MLSRVRVGPQAPAEAGSAAWGVPCLGHRLLMRTPGSLGAVRLSPEPHAGSTPALLKDDKHFRRTRTLHGLLQTQSQRVSVVSGGGPPLQRPHGLRDKPLGIAGGAPLCATRSVFPRPCTGASGLSTRLSGCGAAPGQRRPLSPELHSHGDTVPAAKFSSA